MSKVVYTCINGKYDTLKEPTVITEGWDYICFCDDYPDHVEDTIWKIITIGKTNDVIRYQRKKKIYNEWIFDSYDLSIWVDGSIQIKTDLDKLIEPMFKMGSDFMLMAHPSRNCIYEEAKACLMLKKDKQEIILNQIAEYKKEGLPNNVGMVATGIMIRIHNEEVRDFCKSWLDEVMKHSLRDQLSFNYMNWKKPIEHLLMPFGILYNQFQICQHSR